MKVYASSVKWQVNAPLSPIDGYVFPNMPLASSSGFDLPNGFCWAFQTFYCESAPAFNVFLN